MALDCQLPSFLRKPKSCTTFLSANHCRQFDGLPLNIIQIEDCDNLLRNVIGSSSFAERLMKVTHNQFSVVLVHDASVYPGRR